jgi:hypothetical protein
MVGNATLSIQQTFNRRTEGCWNEFTSHRGRMSRLIRESVQASKKAQVARTLCVMGAGNCNDLDLQELSETFDSIALLDIDTDAVSAGMFRQGITRSAKIAVIEADLLGTMPELSPYDVVLSSCVLSQLIGEAVRQSASPEALLAVRRKHCLDALRLTSLEGAFLLVTDFVAEATVPELMGVADYRLAELVQRLAQQGNFFHCLNPFAVEAFLTRDPAFRDNGQLRGRRQFWRWNMGESAYLVAAWRSQRVTTPGRDPG